MGLQDDVRNLSSLPAFGELEPDALRLLAFSAETRILRTGDTLFRTGDPSDGAYVVRSGSFTVAPEVGSATILRAPALVGEVALLVETARPATLTAREPSSVLKISRVLFRRILSEFPSSAVQMRRSMARRLAALQRDFNSVRLAGEAAAHQSTTFEAEEA